MDIKTQINEIVNKITSDPKLLAQFKEDPVKAIEAATGLDLPDDACNKVIDAVKVQLTADKVAGIADGLKKLF